MSKSNSFGAVASIRSIHFSLANLAEYHHKSLVGILQLLYGTRNGLRPHSSHGYEFQATYCYLVEQFHTKDLSITEIRPCEKLFRKNVTFRTSETKSRPFAHSSEKSIQKRQQLLQDIWGEASCKLIPARISDSLSVSKFSSSHRDESLYYIDMRQIYIFSYE